MRTNETGTEWKVFAALAALTLAVLMLVSPDSCLHHINDRYDSGWFLTCGRAWACGLAPYVDFADSKGPLLWLIYAAGYRLSPTDYLGVFWLSWLFYVATEWVCYLTARLFLPSRLQSATVAVLMFLAWFNPVFFNEVRCEDFCYLPQMLSLWATCRVLYGRRPSGRGALAAAAVVGFSTALIAMMKFNIAAMNLVFAVVLLLDARRDRKELLRRAGVMLLVSALTVVPMALLLASMGSLSACVDEYLVVTVVTTMEGQSAGVFLLEALRQVGRWGSLTWLCLAVNFAGCVWFGLRQRRYRWFPAVVFLTCLSLTSLLARQAHHFEALSFTMIFTAAAFFLTFRFGRRADVALAVTVAVAAVVCATVQNFVSPNHHENFITYDNDRLREYNYVAGVIDSVGEHPSLLCWQAGDVGLGTRGEALPVFRHYVMQAGFTEAMYAEQDSVARTGSADCVVIWKRNEPVFDATLRGAGYVKHTPPVASPLWLVYTKKP